MKIVTRSFLRYPVRRRGLTLVQILGIASGVAAVVGMALSAHSALTSFGRVVDFLKGKATHSIERPAGPMDETVLRSLVNDPAVETFAPVIDRRIRLGNGHIVRILGIDPFLDRRLRPDMAEDPSGTGGKDPEQRRAFLFDARAVRLDTDLARDLKAGPGGTISTERGVLHATGTFSNPSGQPLIIMDIANAQRLFDLPGLIDRVDLIVSDDASFRSRFRTGFQVQSRRGEADAFTAMLGAFSLNLQALSLLALFVGVFLVYNTAMFAVVSRRKETGILRSLGARRSEIVRAFLTEVLLLGASGGVAGGVLGYLLSRFLTGLMGDTISSHYMFLRPTPPPWSWWIIAGGLLLGCAACLLGALYPLLEVISIDPAKALQGRVWDRRNVTKAKRSAFIGLGVFILSMGLFLFSSRHVYLGFAGVFCFLAAMSLTTGHALILITPVLRRGLSRIMGLPGRIAAGTIGQNIGRTGVAVAAFMVALSLSIGMGSMIGSFRESLKWWMDNQIRGDIYIGAAAEVTIPERFFERIRSLEGVRGVYPYRNSRIVYQGRQVHVTAVDAAVLQANTHFAWLAGGRESWDKVREGAVIVSESFFRNFGTGRGTFITVDGIKGPSRLLIAGVFYDYTTEHGLIMMDRATYLKVFNDHTINSVGILLRKGDPLSMKAVEKVKKMAADEGLPVYTREELHNRILTVFDSTFAVTYSMRIMAIVVAFFGIAGALLTLFMERRREFGIYRALGFSRSQVATIIFTEGLCMGLISFLLSLFTGTGLAWVLIKVINLQSFNWTIFFHLSFSPYLQALLTAILASLGAAVYPVLRMWRTYPELQIREE